MRGDADIDKEMAVASLQVESLYDITPTVYDEYNKTDIKETPDW